LVRASGRAAHGQVITTNSKMNFLSIHYCITGSAPYVLVYAAMDHMEISGLFSSKPIQTVKRNKLV
jgi:hypothetical protein